MLRSCLHLSQIMSWTLGLVLLTMVWAPTLKAADQRPFPALYPQPRIYQAALNRAQEISPLTVTITGLTIPHHLLAVELMANSLALVRGQKYKRIIILSPDHFYRGKTFFSVSIRPFSTCLGSVPIDIQAADHVLQNP